MHLTRAWVRGGIGLMLAVSLAGSTLVDDFDVILVDVVVPRLSAEQAAAVASAYLTQAATALGLDSGPDVLTVTAVPAGRADLAEPMNAPRPDADELKALAGGTWRVIRAQGAFVPRSTPAGIEPRIARTGFLIVDGDTGEIWGLGMP